jgi:HSP20 family molecular chaperone IbpA
VSVGDGTLKIRGEKKYEREENEKGQYRMERSYGLFERAIPLPVEVHEAKAKAEFKNGVLRLTLPKRPGAQSRRNNRHNRLLSDLRSLSIENSSKIIGLFFQSDVLVEV